ncbi:hypothetical protein HBI56_151500 [Parastagonospora nodorum]|uniref:TPM domain-containing protein n=1 Tax=Phaeosphaeria nodorum (strain SN15 / ATCC MYA-4574 / FGSC 10173) TaxID=321614 RepID=A0A7U2FJH3_PHANO|nr:hypothetical protein HBH56_183010 [Parastagonospora nodorum]QRD04166.1 hypothetical protein JI435_129000 [Parastagonospora nodorum SN15]KAH3926168.1 hypothetical protein HBH54_172160 [Parastagonospora nodorum]KAH3944828.1 hypothetical protein HBH53_152750 [Parastagonospora nodorum]KAH3962530.1 hypothetical protein HBH52_223660 [Parastagonospora nodorum]
MMKLIYLPLLLAAWLISADLVAVPAIMGKTPRHIKAVYDNDILDQRENATRNTFPRAQREICSAPRRSDSHQRRSLIPAKSVDNVFLIRRTMSLPEPGHEEEFIMKETADAVPAVWEFVHDEKGVKEEIDMNTALFQDFKQKRSVAAIELKGCTVLAIISRKGVYMGHYWEDISFVTDQSLIGGEDTQEAIFERTVLNGIRDGIKGPKRATQMSFTRFAQELGDEHVRAFLIRPDRNSADGPEGYPVQWQKMKEVVVSIMPKIAEDGRWNEVIYTAGATRQVLQRTSAGRVLFKIDPEHVEKASRRAKATRLAVLWVETREVYRDEWQE